MGEEENCMNKIEYRLSHIHLKVKNIKKAVADLQNAGFTVEWGHKGAVSPNAFIWFNDHAFIEIYIVGGPARLAPPFMRMGYGKEMGDRFRLWSNAPEGFSDFAIEPCDAKTPSIPNFEKVRQSLLQEGFSVSRKMIGSRRNPRDENVAFGFCGINPDSLPFLVTAYSIPQIPEHIEHRNGVDRIYRMEVSCTKEDMAAMQRLVGNDPKVMLIPGKETRITKVVFAGKGESFVSPLIQGTYGMNVDFVSES